MRSAAKLNSFKDTQTTTQKKEEKKLDTGNPTVRRCLKLRIQMYSSLDTSHIFIETYQKMFRKSISIDDETKALVVKVRKAWIDSKHAPKNKHPFSTPDNKTGQ